MTLAAVVVAVLGLATVAPGQEAKPAPGQTPSFGAEAQVVLLDVVVRDGRGQLVADLRPDEVQVFEDGKRCEVVSFRLIQAGVSTVQPAATQPALPEGTAKEKTEAVAAPSTTPARPAVVALVFDQLGEDAARRARTAAERFAAGSFPTGTSFGVFKTGFGLRVLQPFTTDRATLTPAIHVATSGADARGESPLGTDVSLRSESLSEQAGRTLADAGGLRTRSKGADEPVGPGTLGEISGSTLYFIDVADRTRQAHGSIDGLLAIVKGLQPVQGRKTIVYFSEGLHTTGDARGLYDSMVGEANRANVTFYNFDARGLTISAPDRAQQALADAASVLGGRPDDIRRENLLNDTTTNPQSNLGALASDTGGFLVANTENLRPALERVAAEVRSYYEAAYVPAVPAQDGRFRRISVKVSRPGVTLRTRSGYFATPAGSPRMAAYELPLMTALEARPPRRDFEVQAAALQFRPRGSERESVILVQVPLAGVQLTSDTERGTYRGHLSVLTVVEDASGAMVARLVQDWPTEGPLSELERRKQGQTTFRHALALAPGRYTLETAVQDQESAQVAVERAAFEVPAAADGLALSTLSVVRRVDVGPVAAEPTASPTPADPLHVGRLTVAPVLGPATLAPNSRTLRYFVTVYPAAGQAPVEVGLEIRQDGRTVAHALPPLPPPGPDGAVPLFGTVGIDSLAPGPYELVIKASQGPSRAEATTLFAIPKPPLTSAATAAPVDPELAGILERAGQYVVDYEQDFRALAARELYQQETTGGTQRQTTRAEMIFARLPGDIPWGSFRDVYEVNGRPLREEDRRLESLFSSDPSSAPQRAEAILRQNSAWNFGTAVRTVNLPTLPLLFLHPRNRFRFSFRTAGTETVAGIEAQAIDFEETARPTLVHEAGSTFDLPAAGRFWIDARHGTVVRTRTRFRFGEAAVAELETDYAPEPKLAMWVPVEMRERYEDVTGAPKPVFGSATTAVAQYSGFRRFEVVTQEQGRVPE